MMMAEPLWVLDEVVIAIHKHQLAEHGGAVGVRDAGLQVNTTAALTRGGKPAFRVSACQADR